MAEESVQTKAGTSFQPSELMNDEDDSYGGPRLEGMLTIIGDADEDSFDDEDDCAIKLDANSLKASKLFQADELVEFGEFGEQEFESDSSDGPINLGAPCWSEDYCSDVIPMKYHNQPK